MAICLVSPQYRKVLVVHVSEPQKKKKKKKACKVHERKLATMNVKFVLTIRHPSPTLQSHVEPETMCLPKPHEQMGRHPPQLSTFL